MTRRAILVVEDEDSVRAVVAAVLLRHGFDVLSASGGEQALAIIARHHDSVVLVLTDLLMPQMDGHALAARIHDDWPRVPVLFMSGLADDRPGIAPSIPAHRLLQKPFTPEALIDRVHKVLQAPSDFD